MGIGRTRGHARVSRVLGMVRMVGFIGMVRHAADLRVADRSDPDMSLLTFSRR